MQRSILHIVPVLFFCLSARSQDAVVKKDSLNPHLNPLLLSAFKKPIKPNPNLNEHFRSPRNQLMYWSDYYLTDAQLEAKYREQNRSLGEQIAVDILRSIIYGKPKVPAVIPKF